MRSHHSSGPSCASPASMSSGGLWGKGHGNSTQVKLGFLSKGTATTDCLAAVIAEEGGFAMMCLILLLELGVIFCCARIAMSAAMMTNRKKNSAS